MTNKIDNKELIYLFRKLQNKYIEDKTPFRKLFVELITPEWYYSDSYAIDFNFIDWKILDNCDFIRNWVRKFNIEKIVDYNDNFEKSFSSWYQPYHFFLESKWGMHIRSDSILRTAKKFYKNCPNIKNNITDSVKTAFLYTFFHHQYHNIIENYATLFEIKNNNPNLYSKYYLDIYSKELHLFNCLEEILANKNMLQNMIELNINKKYLIEEFKSLQQVYTVKNDKTNNLLEEKLINLIYSRPIHSKKPDKYNFELVNLKYKNDIPIWIHNIPKPLH